MAEADAVYVNARFVKSNGNATGESIYLSIYLSIYVLPFTMRAF